MGSHVKYPINVGKLVGLPGLSTSPPLLTLFPMGHGIEAASVNIYIGMGLIDMQ